MFRWVLPCTIAMSLWGTAAQARSFEGELSQAKHVAKLARVIGPFLQKCGRGASLRAIQCRAIRARMQHRVKHGTYWSVVNAVRVGSYDSTRLNFPVSVVGCLTCNGPAKLDRRLYGNKPWYVTTDKPRQLKTKNGKPIFVGLELNKIVEPVGPSQVANWMKRTLPNLKVQLIYQVDGTRWPARLGNGLVVKLTGYRLYNQCTGKVMASNPPSTAAAPKVKGPTCGGKKVVARRVEPRRKTLPSRLGSRDIKLGMKRIAGWIQQCYDQYQVPGLAVAMVTVKGSTGKVAKVKVLGKFKGSPTTGKCLVEAVKKASFKKFSASKMTFRYRWYLR
jgi:hypothetical protein